MIEIEFIRDYKRCYKKGRRKKVHPHFAKDLIDLGFAKALSAPPKNKMVERAEKEKRSYYVG